MTEVRIANASIEEDEPTGEVVIRGVLDQTTLKYINMGWYQREQGFSQTHTTEIVGAFFGGSRVPDVVIGMRGQRCASKDGTWSLRDKCYCVDGGQRRLCRSHGAQGAARFEDPAWRQGLSRHH
ncbi:hypothetical protein ACVMHY_004252 [Bradyrhizobium barranii subsp. barranii]